MKKSLLLAMLTLVCACSEVSQLQSSSSDTTSAKMRTCLMAEANSRYQAGTLFTNSVKETATDMVKTCAKNLALQSAGISAENQTAAENIISNLKNMAASK